MKNDSLATKYPKWSELLQQGQQEPTLSSIETKVDDLLRFFSLLNEIEQENIASYSQSNEDQRNKY